MKKLIAILLAALFALSMAACGSDNTPDTPDAPDTTAAAQNTDGETTTEKAEKVKVSRGVITGDVYENTFAGFTFTKSADWAYLTDDEIAATVDVGQAQLDLNSIEEALAEKASIYDMTAMSELGESVMVCYENTMLTTFRKITADEYINALKTQLQNVSTIQYTLGDVSDATLGDTEFKKFTVSAVTNGVEMTQAYYIRAIDQYIVGVIATAFSAEGIASIEAMFN